MILRYNYPNMRRTLIRKEFNMGCDIHLYSETKKDGVWVADKLDTLIIPTPEEIEDGDSPAIKSSYSNRWYFLFGLLAGVRYDTELGWKAKRNIPNDCSQIIKDMYKRWEGDAHSASYLTVDEIKHKIMELTVSPESDAPEAAGALNTMIQDLPDSEGEQRIVFWFDN